MGMGREECRGSGKSKELAMKSKKPKVIGKSNTLN